MEKREKERARRIDSLLPMLIGLLSASLLGIVVFDPVLASWRTYIPW
jgi:hypothetical protein